MTDVGFFIGALVPTFLLSRLLLWLLRGWQGRLEKLLFVYAASLGVACLLGGMGMADGGAFAPVAALAGYWLPQLIWFLIDSVRYAHRQYAAEIANPIPNPVGPVVVDDNPTNSVQRVDLLQKLHALRESGALSDAEFEQEKKRLLNRS